MAWVMITVPSISSITQDCVLQARSRHRPPFGAGASWAECDAGTTAVRSGSLDEEFVGSWAVTHVDHNPSGGFIDESDVRVGQAQTYFDPAGLLPSSATISRIWLRLRYREVTPPDPGFFFPGADLTDTTEADVAVAVFADDHSVPLNSTTAEERWLPFGEAEAGRIHTITYGELAGPDDTTHPWDGGPAPTDSHIFELPVASFDWFNTFRLVIYKFSPAQNEPRTLVTGDGEYHHDAPIGELISVDLVYEYGVGGMQLETLAIG